MILINSPLLEQLPLFRSVDMKSNRLIYSSNVHLIRSGITTPLRLFVGLKQAHTRDRQALTQSTPLIHWSQLTYCYSCPVRRKLKKPIKIGFLLPAAISIESEMSTPDSSVTPSQQLHRLECRCTCELLHAQVREIKAVACMMTE